ncbi:MAG: TRAP transporter small permease [Candidatus Marinimicrobia bacterium]|nr:TRAP transporter small permease [Candidatus Neomarinimicrobiota bacterium]MCF7827390.1 TRAP transporter small permease [Candidatus Neomarinimicrobiota bacterium]MCF7881377.1 TRAP transporter small permease [Candidatus Neomarinimicrobiota bacterium]
MKKFIAGVDFILKWFVIVVMAANVLNVLWQILTRFILANPSSWTEELARYLLIWVALLGAAYAHRLKMHIAIDFVAEKFQGTARHYSRMFIQACVFIFALIVMVIGGMRIVDLTLSLGQVSAALQVPMGYVYSVIPVSGILIMFYSGLFFADELRDMLWDQPRILEPINQSSMDDSQTE